MFASLEINALGRENFAQDVQFRSIRAADRMFVISSARGVLHMKGANVLLQPLRGLCGALRQGQGGKGWKHAGN